MSMLSRFAATGGGVATDPYWANVSYLLVGNGANGTTTNIVDSSSNNLTTTITGNTVISTTQSKYGSGSVYFDGSGDYLSTTAITLSGDFTLECWIYQTAKSSGYVPIISGTSGSYNFPLIIDYQGSGYIGMYLPDATAANSGVSVFNLNTWTYIACSRSGTTVRLFANGVQAASASSPVSVVLNNYGGWSPGGNSFLFNGYIYDLRITNGIARYTSNFTPPTGPLPIG